MYIDKATEQKLEDFFDKFPLKSYPKKTTFINDYSDPEGVFYLQEGKIRQYTFDRKGNEVTVNIFHNHTIVPMSWLVTHSRNDYNFDTLVESKLRIAPKVAVEAYIKSNPELLFELLSGTFRRLDNTYMRIVHLMSSSAYVRILHILIIQAKRKQSKQSRRHKKIILRFMSYDLAAYCGLSKETVSREFKKLKERKLAKLTRQGIEISSIEKLENELIKHL